MQTTTKTRLQGYWTQAAELREVKCWVCGARTNLPVSTGWQLADNGDRWCCKNCTHGDVYGKFPLLDVSKPTTVETKPLSWRQKLELLLLLITCGGEG